MNPLEPQVFDVLEYLIRNRHRVVSKDELLEAVWHGRVISEATLNSRINAARQAIGDSGREQRLIRTSRRKGFRFVGAVSEEGTSAQQQTIAPCARQQSLENSTGPPSSLHRKPSLLVLSLAPAGEDELARLSQGVFEDVIAALTHAKSFGVIDSNLSCSTNEVPTERAKAVGATYLLVCSAREVDKRVRLTGRLIAVDTGLHIWARSYTEKRPSGFASQDLLTGKLMASFEARVYEEEQRRIRDQPIDVLDGRGCVLKALSIARRRTPENYVFAEKLLMRAAELDPACARAHALSAWLAGASVLSCWKPRNNSQRVALEAAQRAMAIDDADPWAHFAMGWALTQNRFPDAAIEEYREALAVNPYFPEAYYCLGLALAYVGRTTDALAALEAGERLGAREAFFVGLNNSARAGVYFCAEKPHEAARAARLSIRQGPDLVASQRQLVVNSVFAGKMDEARPAFERFNRLVPDLSLSKIANGLPNIRDDDLNRTLDALRRLGLE